MLEERYCSFLDLAKPQITPNINRTTILEGGTLNISCSSNSVPAAGVKWINGSNSTVTNSSVLFINSTMRQDDGIYYCIATSILGSSASDPIDVDVVCKFETYINCYLLNYKVGQP